MVKTVSATEAKNRLGAVLQEVSRSNQPILIEVRGQPHAVLISTAEWDRFQQLDRQMRLSEAARLMDEIRAEAAVLNSDLSAEEADALAIEVVAEIRGERREEQRRIAESEPTWIEDNRS